jgi:hypothetical protein
MVFLLWLSLTQAQLKYRLRTNWTSALDFVLHLHRGVLFSGRARERHILAAPSLSLSSFAFLSQLTEESFELLPLVKPTKPSIPPLGFVLDLTYVDLAHGVLVRAHERNRGKTLTQEVRHESYTHKLNSSFANAVFLNTSG